MPFRRVLKLCCCWTFGRYGKFQPRLDLNRPEISLGHFTVVEILYLSNLRVLAGWPKLISQVVMATPDKGAAVTLLVPAMARFDDGSTVTINTSYPFEDTVRVTCSVASTRTGLFPLYIRIPQWAANATLDGKPARAGSWNKQSCSSTSATTFRLDLHPEIRIETWAQDRNKDGQALHPGYSVVRGPLLYSLPIRHNYSVYGHHFGSGSAASNDYYLHPLEDWAYALQADPAEPSKSLTFVTTGAYRDGDAPFNRSGPLFVMATLRPLPTWNMIDNSAAPPPHSPACVVSSNGSTCGPPRKVKLVPHGFTELRIGEFPLA
jgi:uncharacterized protein